MYLYWTYAEDILVGKIKIKFLGRIHDEKELSYMYSLADVVVIPSRMENLTQMGTESMSCGTPVVAFDVGGTVILLIKQPNFSTTLQCK